MGHVSEQRLIKLLEVALLDYLKNGEIPTTGELDAALTAAEQEHGNLVRSAVGRAELPVRWQESSASEFNTFIEGLSQDLGVLFKALTDVSGVSILSLAEWSARATSLEARLNKLKARCQSLVLTQTDSAGYVSFVEDGFFSLENISDDTTASVDMDNGEVLLSVDKTVTEGADQGTAIDLNSASVALEIINKTDIVNASALQGMDLSNLLKNSAPNTSIDVKVSPRATDSITLELKVTLPQEEEISKISLLSNQVSSVTVVLQYSTDGYRWENVNSDSYVQSGTDSFVFRFEKTKMTYFKFIVTKDSPDGIATSSTQERPARGKRKIRGELIPGPVYAFSFQQIAAYNQQFFANDTGEDLYTELRYPQLAGSNVSFARATLETCEESPDGCNIDYYLRAYDGTSYTNWIKSIPINRKVIQNNITSPGTTSGHAVIDFSTPESLNSDDLTTTFSSSLDTEAINLERDYGTTGLSYRFGSANDSFANFYIPTSTTLISDVILMRNYGYPAAKFPTVTTDKLVRDVECGWGLVNDGTYYCAFYVENSNGLTLNFGSTTAIIDDKTASGKFFVSYGWHVFKTSKANWISLTGSNPSSLADLKDIDPLYPYNHKYMIEGFDYSSSFQGREENVYTGVDRYCQMCSAIQTTSEKEVGAARQIGVFDLLRAGLDTSIFALDEIGTNKTILILKTNSGKADQVNERVRLYYTRRYESFSAVQLRANFKTDIDDRSPVLSYYRIKVK